MSETCKTSNGDTWEIYKDHAEEWRWRCTAQNGKIVGASSQGYAGKEHCVENAERNGMTCKPE